jgi:hypothetical protein
MYTKGSGYFLLSSIVAHAANALGFIAIGEHGEVHELISLQRLYLIVRSVNVALSSASIFLTFLIGRNIIGNGAGLLAALFVAVSPVSSIDAHYAGADTAVTFFILVSLYFAVLAKNNINFVLLSMFFAGVAGAFKYPGISAVLFGVTAAILFSKKIDRSLSYIVKGLPLLALGFVLVFPSIVIFPEQFFGGIQSEFYKKLSNQETNQHIMNVALYPWFLAKVTGVLFIFLVFISVIFNAIKISEKTIILLSWFIVYGFIMAGSSMALIRYAVPAIPVAALLIAMMGFSLPETDKKYKKLTHVFIAVTILHLTSITGIHLYKMNALDPRELAASWLQKNIPLANEIAITPSHYGDRYFTVPVDPNMHHPVELMMRNNYDASTYLKNANFDIVAANESAWKAKMKPENQHEFWRQLQEEWKLVAVFNNRPFWLGLPMSGELPEDLYYIYQEVRLYSRPSTQ